MNPRNSAGLSQLQQTGNHSSNHCSLSLLHKHGNTHRHILLFIAFQQKHAFYIEFKNCKWLQWRAAANLYKWLILRNF